MPSDTFSFTDRCWQEKAAAVTNHDWGVIPHIPHVLHVMSIDKHHWNDVKVLPLETWLNIPRLPLAVVSVRPGPANWF